MELNMGLLNTSNASWQTPIEQGISNYFNERDKADEKQRQNQLMQMQQAREGLMAGPGGSFQFTPEMQARRDIESQTQAAGLEHEKQANLQQPAQFKAGLLEKGVQQTPEGGIGWTTEQLQRRAIEDRKQAAEASMYEAHAKNYLTDKTAANTGKSQSKAYDTITKQLEMMRGNPAVQQAEKDIYAADKANSLIKLYPDPNKLSPQQINLLASEVGKIASGGVPTQHELEGITPQTFQGRLASITQKFTNRPSPANAAAFIKQYKDYLDALRGDAQKVVEDVYGRKIKAQKSHLNSDDYQILNDLYLNRFGEQEQSHAPASQGLMQSANSVPQAAPQSVIKDGITYVKQGNAWIPQ